MDSDYFTEKTGIKVSNPTPTAPAPPKFNEQIKNKLDKIYGSSKCECGKVH